MALTFKFNADGSGFTKGLDKMRSQAKSFSGSVSRNLIGAFAGGAALAGLKSWINGLDRIGKLATRLGKSAESLQRIGYAAELNGTNLETVADALTKVEKNAGQANVGMKSYSDAFGRLGINQREFVQLAPEEQLIQLASAYQEARKSGTGMSDVLLLLGGRAKEMLPLLSQAPEDLKKTFDSASVASEETVRKAEAFNDAISKIQNLWQGWIAAIFEGIAKAGIIIAGFGDSLRIVVGEEIDGLARRFVLLGKVIKEALSGNLSGAKEAFRDLGGVGDDVASKIEERMQVVRSGMKGAMSQFDEKKPGVKADNVEQGEAEAQAKREKEIAKIKQDMERQEKAFMDSMMSAEEKRLSLVKRRVELEEKLDKLEGAKAGSKEELDYLKAEKELFDVDTSIHKIDKNKEDDAKKNAQEAAAKQESLAKREAEIDEQNLMANLSRKEKASYLRDKQNKLFATGSEEDRVEAKSMELEIKELEKPVADAEVETEIFASSLASIGGGGNAAIHGDPQLSEAKQQTALLREAVGELKKDKSGSSETPEI